MPDRLLPGIVLCKIAKRESTVRHGDLFIIEINAAVLRQSSDACHKQLKRAFVRILLDRVDRLSRFNAQISEAARAKT
ncbi:MAG: hypothetical protein ABI648_03780 [Betaproteobacteria bacterium]|jgi:hypothetical protein